MNVKCESCSFGIPVDESERVILCDNPYLKSYGKNVKHGHNFSCGYGEPWEEEDERLGENFIHEGELYE